MTSFDPSDYSSCVPAALYILIINVFRALSEGKKRLSEICIERGACTQYLLDFRVRC